ncbi:FadR family transcriptional regulator, partial [Mycobacterium tuberculosis]|nr:FadR family transcriptional regulator [Mycobacterium tuberculosis]
SLAALRATQKQRVEIVAAYERMKTGHASPQEAILADKQFHLAILDATHNPVLQSLRQTIESILDAIFPHTVGTFTHNLDN